jgi:hypothetical protein
MVRPQSGLRVAQIRPPWAWTIDWLIASPMPRPSCLAVTKRSKIRFRSLSATPMPVAADGDLDTVPDRRRRDDRDAAEALARRGDRLRERRR